LAVGQGFVLDISKDLFLKRFSGDEEFESLVKRQHIKREEVLSLWRSYNFPQPEEL